MATTKSNEAWTKILNDYSVLKEIDDKGYFYITSKTINKYREARLMAKWDTYESLPKSLKDNAINILPVNNRSYILGKFDLYKDLPEFQTSSKEIKTVTVPYFETINIDNINSESNAINVLLITDILSDFLNEDDPIQTFNGRMGSGMFDFNINTFDEKGFLNISVESAQIEIDAGFETKESVTIMEAKNVINNNMNIRQLYYPYRLWRSKVRKPIRNVFSIYSNKVYKLLEYEFTDPKDFSSIRLIKEADYSLEDTTITIEDILNVHKNIEPFIDEDNLKNGYPTPQANSISKLISLMEILSDGPKSKDEIAELMEFDVRQADYYFNAGRYLQIMEYTEEDGQILRTLSQVGEKLLDGSYRHRQLTMVSLLFEHHLFHELFKISYPTGKLSKNDILDVMEKYNSRENLTTRSRRSSTIKNWIEWIYTLAK